MFVDVSSAGPVQESGHRPAVHRDRGQDAELKENSQVGQNKKIFLVFYSTILGSMIKSSFLAGHSFPDTLGFFSGHICEECTFFMAPLRPMFR